MHMLEYRELIAAARKPEDAATLALAGVIAMAPYRAAPYDVPLAGLDRIALGALCAHFFPDFPMSFMPDRQVGNGAERGDEFTDLLALLLEHRTVDSDETRWLAHALATASMGANHLWQDLGLPDRSTLSWLMKHHFTTLAMRNANDMKWKKFFYRQLCEREGLFICRSPSCGVCTDHAICFGPEEGRSLAASGVTFHGSAEEISSNAL